MTLNCPSRESKYHPGAASGGDILLMSLGPSARDAIVRWKVNSEVIVNDDADTRWP